MREVLENGKEIAIEAEIVDRAGNVRPYAFTGKPLRMGGRDYMIGIGRDITLRKRAEQQMARAKERLDLALTSSSLALWDWDLKANRVYFNESWSSLLGDAPRESTFPGEEVLRLEPSRGPRRLHGRDQQRDQGRERGVRLRVPRAQRRGRVDLGAFARQGHAARRAEAGAAPHGHLDQRDQAQGRGGARRVPRDARRADGLPNRVLLHDRLEQCIVNAARNKVGFAFMFIDLDRFKTINDSLGHQVGDELLKRVAARLTACVRASDTVARLGGDEFAVILENLGDEGDEGAQSVAEKMIAAMGAPMLINDQHLNTSCSIGISLYPDDGKDSATLMKHADVAMYFAKEKGRNNYQFFSAEMNARAQERLSVENYLRLALRRNELVHPLPAAHEGRHGRAGRRRGADPLAAPAPRPAAARQVHRGRRGFGSHRADRRVGAGAVVRADRATGSGAVKPGLRLSVNLSVGQVVDGERLYRAVSQAIERSGIDPATLELELTESHPDAEHRGEGGAAAIASASWAWAWRSTTSAPATRRCPT